MEKANSGNMMLKHVLGFLVFSWCSVSAQYETRVVPGLYWEGAVKIGVNGDRITGMFDVVVAGGNQVCQFYFQGRRKKDKIQLNIRNFVDTGVESGNLVVVDDSTVGIYDEGGPVCSHIPPETRGERIALFKREPFLEIRVVKSEKAFFYSEKRNSAKRKAYLVKYDVADVTEISGEWRKVTFGKTTGWMKASDFVGQ